MATHAMKRLRRTLAAFIATLCVVLLAALIVTCLLSRHQPLGLSYRHTEDLPALFSDGSIAPARTPHFYCLSIHSWKLSYSDWHSLRMLAAWRQEREVMRREIEHGRNADGQVRAQARVAFIDQSGLLGPDGLYFGSVLTRVSPRLKTSATLLGVAVEHGANGEDRSRRVSFPISFILALLLISPLLHARSLWLCRRRRKLNLCPICNYDLRATPRQCPECGSAPPKAPGEPAFCKGDRE
jgi:hypothetical protein